MFIETEAMPNPAAMKFLPDRQVLAEGRLELRDKAQAADLPLAQRLFDIPGVSGVTLGTDYITITKEGSDWQQLKPAVFGAILDYFASGGAVIAAPAPSAAAPGGAEDLATEITEALRQVIDPELGYNIVDLGLVYEVLVGVDGTVRVIMTTTTPGCPATGYLVEGSRDAVGGVPGVESVEVKLTHDPRWTPEMMSPEAKVHLGIRDGGGW